MKRIALVAAMVAFAGCAKNDEVPADTSPAMAPAPAPAVDSARIADSIRADSIRQDSIKRASSKKSGTKTP